MRHRSVSSCAIGATGLFAAAVGLGEFAQWWTARQLPPAQQLDDGTTGLIVLGFPSRRDATPGSVQRWRVAIAERTWQRVGNRDRIVFSGGPTDGQAVSEAKVMADLALDERWLDPDGIVDPTVVMIEDQSTSTWENVDFSLPLVDECDQIVIVSDALHAARAIRYATKLRPELADRFYGADFYRFGEAWWIKPFSLLDATAKWALLRYHSTTGVRPRRLSTSPMASSSVSH